MSPASNSVKPCRGGPSEPTRVAVGVIQHVDGRRVLLARRAKQAHQGGLWEFPGGKLEAGEDQRQALARELREEIGVTVVRSEPMIDIAHDYVDKSVLLHVWLVSEISGALEGREGQPLRWFEIDELHHVPLPQANGAIVDMLQRRYRKCGGASCA